MPGGRGRAGVATPLPVATPICAPTGIAATRIAVKIQDDVRGRETLHVHDLRGF